LEDGTIIQPADGTIYALRPDDGEVWGPSTSSRFAHLPSTATGTSTPVGRRPTVRANPNGTRWSMRLIDDSRDDLNASPALGPTGGIAGENGTVHSVPYDYCLAPRPGERRWLRRDR
jgi:hypothetical protein